MENLAIALDADLDFQPNPHAGLKSDLIFVDLFDDPIVMLNDDFTLHGFNKSMINHAEITALFTVSFDNKVSFKQEKYQSQLQRAYLKSQRILPTTPNYKTTFIIDDAHLYYQITLQFCPSSILKNTEQTGFRLMMIKVKDVNQSRIPQPQVFAETFKLTESEADICRYLCLGYEINQIAEIRFVSKHTVRHQLKSIFQKTKIQKQSQLVSHLLSVCMI